MFALQPQQFLGATGLSNYVGYGRPINPFSGCLTGINQFGVADPVTHELQRVALHYQALQQLAIQQQQLAIQQQLASVGGVGGFWPLQAGVPVQNAWPIQPVQMAQFAPMGPLTQRYPNPITDQIGGMQQPQLVPVA